MPPWCLYELLYKLVGLLKKKKEIVRAIELLEGIDLYVVLIETLIESVIKINLKGSWCNLS